MKEWFAAQELAGLPGLPGTKRGINAKAAKEEWAWRPRPGRGGGREYSLASLPEATRQALARRALKVASAATQGTPLAPVPAAEAPLLTALPERQRSKAEAKLWILASVETYAHQAGCGIVKAEHAFAPLYTAGDIEAPDWVRDAVPKVSWSSLANWRRTRAAGESHRLGGQRGGGMGRIDKNPVLRDLIIAQLETQPHLNAAQIRENCAARLGEAKVPGVRRLQHWISRWKGENAGRHLLATNPDSFKSRRQPAFGSASERVRRMNQLWEADGTPADVICRDGRQSLVAIVDVLTRRAKVLVTPSAKAVAVTALLRRCILDWGVPEALKTDNGSDYRSRHVARALAALEVRQELCPVETPEAKPHVERFIETISHDLFERLPGYAGHSVADRQAIRARKKFGQRLGESDSAAFSVALTAAELQEACDTWCESLYGRRRHGSLDGRSPFEVAAAHASEARHIADARALDVLLAEAPGDGWRSVSKKGIRIDRALFTAPELGALVGERVQVRFDAADLGRIYVYDDDGRFVCIAEDGERVGIDRKAHAAAARAVAKAQAREWREEARQRRLEHRPEDLAAEVLARAGEQADRVVAFKPAQQELHETQALEEAARAATADRPRPAPQLTPEEDTAARERLADLVSAPEPSDPHQRPKPSDPEWKLAVWLIEHDEQADSDDRAWLADYLKRPTAKALVDMELRARGHNPHGEEKKAAAAS